MSLLTNEDFTIYQLRAGYLQTIKDGVGERLISLNTSVLNNPAFRAAGWVSNASDIKRTYSPPIPTAITSEYFHAPPARAASLAYNDDEEEGGMVTGHGQGSHETTIGLGSHGNRRRRRKEQLEEDDSSDLSDDSDEEEDKRAAQQIKFSKMPVRIRSGSSPGGVAVISPRPEDVSFVVTSPSRPSEGGPPTTLRRASMGAAIGGRPRRDTTTSSEFSSENELDASYFRRQKVQTRAAKQSVMISERIQEEDHEDADADGDDVDSDLELDDEDVGEASDLSDDDDESASLLGMGGPLVTVDTLESEPKERPRVPPPVTPTPFSSASASPKRQRHLPTPPDLPRLPSAGRPISYVQPVSLLSRALKGPVKAGSPFQQFAQLSGKGESTPLWIKIYAPFSDKPTKPIEVPLRRHSNEGVAVTVAELIGFSLWRYEEEKYEPPLKSTDMTINRWTLRMVEDDEVDYDFPALGRVRPVADFTSNNNRPARGRMRDKPWDEFALVRANDEQFAENEELTPQFSEPSAQTTTTQSTSQSAVPSPVPDTSRSATPLPVPVPMIRTSSEAPSVAPSFIPNQNPINPSFAPMARKNSTIPLLDAPADQGPRSTPRTGVPKTITIHFTDPQSFQTTLLPMPTTSDTYIAELFTMACQRLNLDKALHVLKVRGTQTVAPQDRTVEALGDRMALDLVRRRFVGVGDGWGTTTSGTGSPVSDSPNAPLLLTQNATPKQTKKKAFMGLQSTKSVTDINAAALYGLGGAQGKRYLVIRRQPLSFAPSHPRILALDAEFMHVMPAAANDPLNAGTDPGMGAPAGKTTSVHLSSVVGCKVSRKHPKVVRVLVYREKETKRYDFEAGKREEAVEIADVIKRGMQRFRDDEEM